MKIAALTCSCLAVALIVAAPLNAQDESPAVQPLVTIKEVMEKTITPATNTLWSVPESINVVELGGTGPMDADWVKQPAWQPFNRLLLDASKQALAAIRARDLVALQSAGDAIYPPCEGCHAQFNPGVVGAQ
jgi:cytochrome c556